MIFKNIMLKSLIFSFKSDIFRMKIDLKNKKISYLKMDLMKIRERK